MGNGDGGRLKCYVGSLSENTTGMVLAFSKAQAQALLGMGHRRFNDGGWLQVQMPTPAFDRFVVYERPADHVGHEYDGWVARED